jgi:hypothetical protein
MDQLQHSYDKLLLFLQAGRLMSRLTRFHPVHFNRVNQDIADHLSGANGKAAAAFVSFPDSTDPAYYFVTGKDHATWNAFLDDYLIQKLSEAKTLVGATFDAGLTGMLFGKGRTHIFTFQTGFLADLDDDEVPSEEHPLHKVGVSTIVFPKY